MRADWYELHIQIRRELAAEAGEAARAADLSMSAWMRMAIREKLERERAALALPRDEFELMTPAQITAAIRAWEA